VNSTLPQSTGLKKILATEPKYSEAYQTLVLRVENPSAGELRKEYPHEYNSWKNRKGFAKNHKVPWFTGMNSFPGFLLVNGHIPHEKWTLDRIDPTGGYLPENLRWASKATQSQNRTNAVYLNINGESLTTNQAAKIFDKSYDCVRMGIKRHGSAYLSTLQPVQESVNEILHEVDQWDYPVNCGAVADLYPRRREKWMRKPRFFVELVAFELKVRRDKLKSNPSSETKLEADADIAALTPLLEETQAYIDGINKRLYLRYCATKVVTGAHYAAPVPDWDKDYYEGLVSDGCPWATYPKEVDPVFNLFPRFGK
jgi:hypothetical protein